MKTTLVATVAVAASIAVAVVIYLTKPIHAARDQRAVLGVSATTGSPAQVQPATVQNACVGSVNPGVSRGTLRERYRWALNLMDQKLFDAALPELKNIAAADPGFPGINLDIAQSLTALNRPEEAQHAIDSQLAISDCLSKLSAQELDAYCGSELATSGADGCRQELARIQQATTVEAVVARAEARPGAPESGNARPASRALGITARTAPIPRRPVASHRAAPKDALDKSLMNGDGTDSALGAYSKQ